LRRHNGEKQGPTNDAVDMTAVRAKLSRLLANETAAAAEAQVKERTKELEEQLEALRAEHQLA
jgi:hypothetical protein